MISRDHLGAGVSEHGKVEENQTEAVRVGFYLSKSYLLSSLVASTSSITTLNSQ
jgi:hypothetical protein